MLVSAKEMLEKARDGKYAVGQFNINNLEWTKAILLTAQEMNSPVILGVSCGAGKYMTGFKTVASMVSAMIDDLKITVPVALHLDHGTYEACYDCIDAGFSSIMFDGSHYPIEENIEKTKELVKICKEKGLSLEAEVGSIGGEEDGVIGMGECADPNECKSIADLGVTMLAAGIGNIHGKYPANWPGLSFETLAAVKEKVGNMPLVLHGGSGIPDEMIKKAITLGVSKVNVNTECQLYFQEATRKYIEAGSDIVLTNTFGANALKFHDDAYSLEEIVNAAVGHVKAAAEQAGNGRRIYTALDIGPTGKLLKPMGDLDFETAYEAYKEVMIYGEKAGADLIHIETMSDTYELKAAVLAAKENTSLPVFATTIFDERGKLLTGADVPSVVALLEGLRVDAFGINCGMGPEQMIPILEQITKYSSLPVIVKPNAGLPKQKNGQTYYDVSPEEFAEVMKKIVEMGAVVIGGCCGTTPDHIKAMADACRMIPILSLIHI